MAKRKSKAGKDGREQRDEADMQADNMGFPNLGENVEAAAGATDDDGEEGDGDPQSTDEEDAETDDVETSDSADASQIPRSEMLAQVITNTVDEITRFMPNIAEAEERLEAASEEQKKAKKSVEASHLHLAMLCRRLADAKNGKYQPELPFDGNQGDGAGDAPQKKLPKVDQGAAMAIHVLADHGLTDKMCETLESHDVKTVGQLELLMRTDEWWHRKIKGFGGERIDRTVDALCAFRRAHPVPSADDDDEADADASSDTSTTPEASSSPDPADDIPAAPESAA